MSPVQIAKSWWSGNAFQRATAMAVSVSAILGAILTTMHFGEFAEPYWIATRSFTREVVAQAKRSTDNQLLALQIATKQLAIDATQAQIDRLDFELKKNADAADSLKQILNEQIARYKEQRRIFMLELDELRRQQKNFIQ